MTNTKTTKKALFTSILSLFISFTMLMGSTFAWFTDSVTSMNNIIQSGNLDVELWHCAPKDTQWGFGYNENGGKPVESDTELFLNAGGKPILWEPGAGAGETFRIVNAGSLALKYKFMIKMTDASETPEGKDLTDVLKMQIVELENNANGVPVGVTGGVSVNDISLKDGYEIEGELLAGECVDYNVSIDWEPSDNDNDYNVKGGLSIDFGVTLVATQFAYENDSFGNDYDKDSTYDEANGLFSGTDIHNSTTSSGTFKLSSDIKTSDYGDEARYGYGYEYIIRNGADYTLDLNGKTIVHDTVNENANHNALTYLFVANNAGTKLTIDGNGKIYSNNSEGYTCAVQGKDGTLVTINGGEYSVDDGIAVWAGAGSHIVINGGSFVNGNATTDHELIYTSGGVIDIYGGFFHNTDGNYTLNVEDRNRATGFINVYGGTFVNFDPSTGGQDPNNIKVMDGYKVISETQANGDVWYTVVAE